jgi:hypothetical protein
MARLIHPGKEIKRNHNDKEEIKSLTSIKTKETESKLSSTCKNHHYHLLLCVCISCLQGVYISQSPVIIG